MDEMETTADVPADVQQVPQVAAVDPDEVAEHNAKNVANRAKVGRIHAAAALAALVIFGAAHTWATSSGWLLATAGCSPAVGCGWLVAGCWLLASGCGLLAAGSWLLAVG